MTVYFFSSVFSTKKTRMDNIPYTGPFIPLKQTDAEGKICRIMADIRTCFASLARLYNEQTKGLCYNYSAGPG
jgi:hypothetical protein